MAKKEKLARVTIDVPDEKWAELVRITGETEPRRVVEAALRWYVEHHSKGPADA
jgi:Arc/MetJ family transcription regulator